MPRLYIGNLPRRVEERDVKKFFREYGRIRSVDIKNGYGFVEIDDRRDAEDAVHDLDGAKLQGERVTVEMARSNARFGGDRGGGDRGGRGGGDSRNNRYNDSRDSRDRYNSRKPVRSEHRIIVDDLSSRVSWQDLKDLMRKVGEVTFADAHKLRPNQGVVEFSNSSDMKAAIEKYDGYELHGYKLKVYEDRIGGVSKRKSRSRSRSSYRRRSSSRSKRSVSKSRSRSRSKSSRRRSRSRRRSSGSRKRSDSRKRSTSGKRSRSKRSTSKAKSYSKSKSPVQKWAGEEEEAKSKSKSVSRSRSRSVEPAKKESSAKSLSRSRSRSKSASKEMKDDRSESRSRSNSKNRSNSPCDERDSGKSVCSDSEDRPNANGAADRESPEKVTDEIMDSN